jgi:glycosyltransferase involved in cell wall biosynthesis
MKRLALFLLFLGAVFGGSLVAGRWFDQRTLPPAEPLSKKENRPAAYTLTNLPFTLVVVGVDNGASLAKTLSSIFSQNYENYRLIYIDDASDDGSFDLARDLIYDSEHVGQVTLVQNEQRLGILANLFRAVQGLDDREIVVVLQGEDWLAHEWVLQRLNAYYADPDLWLAYAQSRDFPTYQLGTCREWKEAAFRNQPFTPSHLNTFYAALFKKIRESDFVSGGKFLPACSEIAYMIPMFEMAKDHFQFIPEILCIHNRQGSYKEDREMQMRCEKFVRALDSYPPLLSLNEVQPCGE